MQKDKEALDASVYTPIFTRRFMKQFKLKVNFTGFLAKLVIVSSSILLIGCLATGGSKKKEFYIVPISGANPSMTLQQAEIVCKNEAKLAGRSAEAEARALNKMDNIGKSGGFAAGFGAAMSESKAGDTAQNQMLRSCLGRAGYMMKEY